MFVKLKRVFYDTEKRVYEDKGQERIPIRDIDHCREWKNEHGIEICAVFFKKSTGKSKMLVGHSPDELDRILGTINT